jgi:hypothetical protein
MSGITMKWIQLFQKKYGFMTQKDDFEHSSRMMIWNHNEVDSITSEKV